MSCCSCAPSSTNHVEMEDSSHAKKHPQPGIRYKRKCRDLFFAILFIAFWCGMIIIAIFSFAKGDPKRCDKNGVRPKAKIAVFSLEYGEDSNGNVCGQNNIAQGVVPAAIAKDLTNYPYLYFPLAPPSYISTNLSGIQRFCISKCPASSSLAISDMLCYYNNTPSLATAYKTCFPPYASTSILYYCVPVAIVNQTTSVFDQLNSRDFVAKVISDVYNSWKCVIVALVAAFLLGLVWLILMRFFAGVTIWFSVWTVMLLLIGITVMFWLEGSQRKAVYDATPANQQLSNDKILWQAFLYTGYALCGISSLVFLFIIFSCSRIHLAAMLAEEASKAFASMFFQLIIWPIVPFISVIVLGIYFVAVAIFAITVLAPQYDQLEQFTGYTQSTILKGLLLYHLFGLLWTFNFIIGVFELTICGAFADWYWSFEGRDLKPFAVARSFARTIFYHLGSVAFGSFLLGLIQFIRLILLYFEAHTKGKENKFSRIAFAIIQCILSCFERFIKFLTKNAYVMIAVYGYSFCNAARRAFKIIVNNPIRVAALNFVNVFVMILGKLFICLATTIGSFIYLKNYTNLNFFFFPLGFIAIFSYVIACLIMAIYDMAIHTLLFCFIEDEARSDGSAEKPYHCSSDLQAFLDTHGGTECCCF